MRLLVQRVTRASVSIEGKAVGEIGPGLVVLVGAVATPGGTAPSAWNKAIPAPPMMPEPSHINHN